MKRETYSCAITVLGATLSLRGWGQLVGLSHRTISRRIKAGMDPADAVFSPGGKPRTRRAYYQANAERLKAKRRARYRAKVLGRKPEQVAA